MTNFILPFSSPEATLARAGGKGANLAVLTRADLAVPPGFLITTDANRTFVDANQFHAQLVALAHQAVELGVPTLLHMNEPVGHNYPGKGRLPLGDIYAFIKAAPSLKLIRALWGGGFPFHELMREVRKIAANVFYDFAASPLLYSAKIFRTVIDIVGSEKVLFGSDFPHSQSRGVYAPLLLADQKRPSRIL